MENVLNERDVDFSEFLLLIGVKAWKTAGFDFSLSLKPKQRARIIKAINANDPFFKGRVKDNQILMYVPKLSSEDNLSVKWWREQLQKADLPFSIQFTDIYSFGYFFQRLKVEPGWYLFTNRIIPSSVYYPWDKQLQLLKAGYRVPNINELVSFLILSHCAGIDLLDRFMLTRTVDKHFGVPMNAGQFINNRINIICEDDPQEAKTNVGIYACKKII